jgi:glyoxylase-like metal-dependent hydrolase (beta-lactamase superfamily II)
VLHELEVDSRTRDVEVKLEGEGPWQLPGFSDGQILFTPGHTQGHVCFLLQRGQGGALFSGDHLAKAEAGDFLSGHPNYNW